MTKIIDYRAFPTTLEKKRILLAFTDALIEGLTLLALLVLIAGVMYILG